MTSVDITFLSSRKRGISPDLRLVKRYLHENVDQINFRYFVNSEKFILFMGRKERKNSVENLSGIYTYSGSDSFYSPGYEEYLSTGWDTADGRRKCSVCMVY